MPVLTDTLSIWKATETIRFCYTKLKVVQEDFNSWHLNILNKIWKTLLLSWCGKYNNAKIPFTLEWAAPPQMRTFILHVGHLL